MVLPMRESTRSGEKSLSDNDVFRACEAACSGIGGKRCGIVSLGDISENRGGLAAVPGVGL